MKSVDEVLCMIDLRCGELQRLANCNGENREGYARARVELQRLREHIRGEVFAEDQEEYERILREFGGRQPGEDDDAA